MDFYIQGLTLGLAYVAPIGMQNLFVINSALTQPRWRALLTALIVIFLTLLLPWRAFRHRADNAKIRRRANGDVVYWRVGCSLHRLGSVKKQSIRLSGHKTNAGAGANRMAGVCGNVVQRAGPLSTALCFWARLKQL